MPLYALHSASMDGEDDEPYSDDNGSIDSMNEIALDHEQKREQEEIDYELLNQAEVMTELTAIANDTAAVIGFSPAVCKILLHSFHWNKEFLIEKFYETGDKDRFLKSCHVIMPGPTSSTQTIKNANEKSTCQICFDDSCLTGLSCGHKFCCACWRRYLHVKIKDECDWLAPCPGAKCIIRLDEDMVYKLVDDQLVLTAYKKLVVNSFVQSNQRLKWCPGTDCGLVAKVAHPECRSIVCNCRTVFCFACSNEWHEPVCCEMLKKWLKKCNDDSETSNWLSANTKDCPKCQVTIEKDGGCNHMTCKNVACRFEFCWTCLGAWKPHGSGWYSCNRFDDSDAKKARDDQERSRAALQRYLHYYNRFVNHKNSLKLECKLYKEVQEKMRQMQLQEYSWIETQYLRKAVDVLSECRRTLMYTYAFAYYLEQNNTATIFQDNQKDLELATEQLSELLEKELDVDKDQLKTWKQTVQDKYRYVQHRRVVLLKHVTEGNARNEWKFTDTP